MNVLVNQSRIVVVPWRQNKKLVIVNQFLTPRGNVKKVIKRDHEPLKRILKSQ